MDKRQELLRRIPQVNEILGSEGLFLVSQNTPHNILADSVREALGEVRKGILSGELDDVHNKEEIIEEVIARIKAKKSPSLKRVINATGVVLHTNLGRSVLSELACERVMEVARGYSNLEYNLEAGSRGLRHTHIEKILTQITGAEAAMVVNNNAAATIICLAALARGKEVVTSRGELIEIGGSFRIPEIMEESGAVLKEVGTTNRTRIKDYVNAYDPEKTGAFLKVHTSNYRVVGFTEEADLADMTAEGHKLGLPVIYDMGSGLFADLSEYGIDEPTVQQKLATGVDVILFSGDKLLGGPQAGIIVGKKQYIDMMKAHPLARAFRVDKMTIAALTATLYECQDMKMMKTKIPTIRMITQSQETLRAKAESLRTELAKKLSVMTTDIEECKDQIGGGSAPVIYLDGLSVSVSYDKADAEKIERRLRKAEVPIICRINKNKILFDVRTIEPEDFERIADTCAAIEKALEA